MCVGTAAVICPIGELTYGDKVYTINNFQTGPWPRSSTIPLRESSGARRRTPTAGPAACKSGCGTDGLSEPTKSRHIFSQG